MINHDHEYVDYCNNIVHKLYKGESLPIALNMDGFMLTLHQLIQAYYGSDLVECEKIKGILERSVKILWNYLMPLDLANDDNSILPAAFEGDYVVTNNIISFYEGELPIALLFVKIALILEDEQVFKVANLVGAFSKIKEDKINDETLTFDLKNGTIGIALLYQTLYFLTNENLYLKRANYWYKKSENLLMFFLKQNNNSINRIDQETICAFEAFKNPKDTIWRKNYFLEFEILLKNSSHTIFTYI